MKAKTLEYEAHVAPSAASAILPRARDAQLPLSYAQTRLWFLDQLEPNSAAYNLPLALHLVGTLEVAALEKSLQEIIHRHEALRTNFITVDGQPTQIIQTATNWTVYVVDLKYLLPTEQEITTQQLAQQQAIQPFDLAKEALIRAKLVVLSETEHVLLLCMHHIVSDGWSMGVFVQELAALYNAYSQGEPSLRDATRSLLPQRGTSLAPLPIQYADFTLWQRNWLQGDVLQSQLSYWQQQLKDAPTLLSLPTDRPRPAVQTFAGAYQEFTLSLELTDRLVKLSQEQGCTLFMTLLAAYDTLLYRYTGVEDILVGSPIANRDRSEIEGLIGFFVNTLVMRSNLADNPSFSELLGRVREMAMSAYSHQHLPFEMLVEALQPERDLSYTPLFQVMFVLQNVPTSQVELTGLSVSPLPIKGTTTKFDLTLIMRNTGNSISKADYFKEVERATKLRDSITAASFNPLERIIEKFRECGAKVRIASEPDYGSYYAGLIRKIENGTQIHIDFAPLEQSEWEICTITAQLSWTLYLKLSPNNNGKTCIYDRRWKPEDEQYKLDSYGYNDIVIADADMISFQPYVGDVLLFNTSNFHYVEPMNGQRVAFTSMIGLLPNGEIIFWS